MEIYEVAIRLKEAEARMQKEITDFEAAAARKWAERKEKIDAEYSIEMEQFHKELSSKTDLRVNTLKNSLKESIKQHTSTKAKSYRIKADKIIREVLEL